jgi:hypothetical protein
MIEAGSILNVLYRDGAEDPIGIFITVEGAKRAAQEHYTECDRYQCEIDHTATLHWEDSGYVTQGPSGMTYYIEPRILLP